MVSDFASDRGKVFNDCRKVQNNCGIFEKFSSNHDSSSWWTPITVVFGSLKSPWIVDRHRSKDLYERTSWSRVMAQNVGPRTASGFVDQRNESKTHCVEANVSGHNSRPQCPFVAIFWSMCIYCSRGFRWALKHSSHTSTTWDIMIQMKCSDLFFPGFWNFAAVFGDVPEVGCKIWEDVPPLIRPQGFHINSQIFCAASWSGWNDFFPHFILFRNLFFC